MERKLGEIQSKTARDRAMPITGVTEIKQNKTQKMSLFFVTALLFVEVASGQSFSESEDPVEFVAKSVDVENVEKSTELLLAFVMFRHGDRTPDQEEIDLYPTNDDYSKIFFPYGPKALTNKGKVRSYHVGQYVRRRYNKFVSPLYLPEEIVIRTTDYARTKMTALTALAALYPPPPAQKWNPNLDWQPVPYDSLPYDEDDLLYWYNCPRYLYLRDKAYDIPEVVKLINPYRDFFQWLSEKTKTSIKKPEDVFYLDNLFQALRNVGLKVPTWVTEVWPKIQEVTKLEFLIESYTTEMVRLASGVLMDEILNVTSRVVAGQKEPPKLRLYSAHENNIASFMSATRVFYPHQPKYGATFSLELRRSLKNGQYVIAAVYSPEAGGKARILPINGCGDQPLCSYDKFVVLTKQYAWSKEDYRKECPKLS